MSELLAHSLQLVMFAAQDLQRHQVRANDISSDDPGADDQNRLRRAMDDIRKGRVAPERVEKHLRDAVKEASKRTLSAGSATIATLPSATSSALERFRELRQGLEDQLADVHQQLIAAAGKCDSDAGRQATALGEALAMLNTVLLDKAVDSPVAPLPATAPAPSPTAGLPCQTQRV